MSCIAPTTWCQMVTTDVPSASPLSQLQPTFRAEYGGLLRCRRCSRCLPASGQAGHRLGGCQVAWGARELRRRRPSQTPQWTPGRVPSAALPEAAAAFPSGLIVHVVVLCAGMNVSVVRSAGGGRWSNPPSPPGASRVREGGPTPSQRRRGAGARAGQGRRSRLVNGDVNTPPPRRSAHTRTSDRERGSGNPRFRAFATATPGRHP